MKWAARQLRSQLDQFLLGGKRFEEFRHDFLGQYLRLPENALPSGERSFWHEVYRLLCVTTQDPVSEAARNQGVIGEADLRERLQEFRDEEHSRPL